jgi:uncharacterized protein (DUF608 family)
MMDFIYRDPHTREISFPLGGIGTGCIGLAGNARLIDWEISNRPNKGSLNGFSHFSIKAELGDSVIDARVLNGDLAPPYMGALSRSKLQSFGFGPHRGSMAGLPHFKDTEFRGEFPIAEIAFLDDAFPGDVSMKAFNPFIPLNDQDSSLPVAMFEVSIQNTTATNVDFTVAMSLGSPFSAGKSVNTYFGGDFAHAIQLGSRHIEATDPEYGDLCVATDSDDCYYQNYWFRGRWFDSLEVFRREFASPGQLENRTYPHDSGNSSQADNDMCSPTAKVSVEPRERRSVRFVISWSFPNFANYWNPAKGSECRTDGCECGSQDTTNSWKNYYATVFSSSADSAIYALKNWTRLFDETMQFKNALFSSTLPSVALEGRQHHTLDMELFGPNSWLTGFYLAALKAGAEMADHLGDAEAASDFRALFEKGKSWVDDNLFNGEYFHQQIDVSDRSILEPYAGDVTPGYSEGNVFEAYWNDEAKEIKYQIAEGSQIDQVNAQWHANLCGLGDIFDPVQRKTALQSIFKYDFKSNMWQFFNPCRNYCLNNEAGLVICDWPKGKYRPIVPLPYSGETQNGYEYQAAILMI